MGWVDKVPRTPGGGLYIGGYHALYQKQELFRQYGISHIVTLLDYDIYEAGHFKQYSHIQIKLDDDPDENILQHFEQTNNYIDAALNNGGAVFVHCAMGKSRSATIVCAYLMWKYNKNPHEALQQLREGRGVCEPNPGFAEQLEVYYDMLHAANRAEAQRIYQQWRIEAEKPRDVRIMERMEHVLLFDTVANQQLCLKWFSHRFGERRRQTTSKI